MARSRIQGSSKWSTGQSRRYSTSRREADLLVVREHTLRYEPGEIAYFENVSKGEVFKRRTSRKETTVNSSTTTTLSTSETQRNIQSTSRFDLQRQSSEIIQQQVGQQLGGPILVNSTNSLTEASSQARNYGQDITSRAVSKITQSVQTQVFQMTTEQFAEHVEHDFDNSKGASDQIVVYQWLDKVSQVQLFSYGKRVLYDFVVEEPAAFLVEAAKRVEPITEALQRKLPFLLRPDQLSLDPNHPFYYERFSVTGYGAVGVQPPPEPQITLGKSYGNATGPNETLIIEVGGKEGSHNSRRLQSCLHRRSNRRHRLGR